MKLSALNKLTASFTPTSKMPVVFLGHGNPMHAISNNEFTQGWTTMASSIPKPNAILCISAHWETNGTYVTAMEKPPTIHDFGGFPQKLFDVQYPAPGSPDLAKETQKAITKTKVGLDDEWGLDHGCWAVLKHLYPNADIPVIQLSLDYSKKPEWHYELAKELSSLREKGILIASSGNIVHNLRMINWKEGEEHDWAVTANEKIKELVQSEDIKSLTGYKNLGKEIQMAVPTPEHYLPLLYTMGLKGEKEKIELYNDKIDLGSISMTSFKIG